MVPPVVGIKRVLNFQIYLNLHIYVGSSALAHNGKSVSLKATEDFIYLNVKFTWFMDGHISYEDSEVIMKRGTDWVKPSLEYIEDRQILSFCFIDGVVVEIQLMVLGVKTMNMGGVRIEQKLRLCGVQTNQKKKPKRLSYAESADVEMSMNELLMDIDDLTIIASSFVFPILKVSICYKPSQKWAALNLGTKERIIRMMEMHVNTLDPPKSKHKRVPKTNGSPPVPVMHSPPRPVTVKDQHNWKIPPCISKWKNPKGYTIPLDKRSVADARGLQEKDLMMKKKERKEQELRALAQKARSERVGPGGTVRAGTSSYTPFEKNMMDTDEPMRIKREHEDEHEHKRVNDQDQPRESKAEREDRIKREKIHEERRREREREKRFEAKDAAMGKKRIQKKLIRKWEKKPTLLVMGKRRGDAPTSYSTSRGVGEKDDGKRKGDDIGPAIKDQENKVLKALYFGKTQRSIDLKVFGGLSLLENVRGNKNKGWKLWRSPSAGCGLSVSSSTKGARMEMEGSCRLWVRVIWKFHLVLMWLLWLELFPKDFMAIKKE
ncbi:SNW/SKI-interacting protein A [Tanacetum coccineum]